MPRQQLWKPFIVVASYVFYGYASWRFCLLLGAVTVGNQAAAVLIARTSGERARSWIVGVAVALDLGVLGVFKYYGFFVENWDRRAGPVLAAAAAADDRAAGRRLVLHLPGDLLRRRRQAPAGGARLDARRGDLPELLPAPRRGADRAGARVPAAAAGAARSDARGGGLGHRADRARTGEEAGDRGHARAHGGRPGVRRPGRVLRRPTCGSPPTPTPPRSTATSAATRTWRSGSRC